MNFSTELIFICEKCHLIYLIICNAIVLHPVQIFFRVCVVLFRFDLYCFCWSFSFTSSKLPNLFSSIRNRILFANKNILIWLKKIMLIMKFVFQSVSKYFIEISRQFMTDDLIHQSSKFSHSRWDSMINIQNHKDFINRNSRN